MKKHLLSAAIAAILSSQFAFAEEAKPDNDVSFNIAGVSDYRYRGLSQTRLKPALQGGADYVNNPSGFYAGTWLSTIKWTKDSGGSGDIEVDLYAGKKGEIVKDVSYDVGVLSYIYPSNDLGKVPGFVDANTTEIYGQVGYGPAYIKYSHSVTNLFGFVDSKNSGYLDVGASFEVAPGYTLGLHYGHQSIKNNTTYAYDDWKIGVTKEFAGITFGLAAVGTNADKSLWTTSLAKGGKFLGKSGVVLSAVKAF